MNELPDNGERATPFDRFWWSLVGLVCCLVKGELDKYPALMAQYKLETGYGKSWSFYADKNGFGMHYPTPGATAGRPAGSEGVLAVFPSYWACWTSRLGWDERHGVKGYRNAKEYFSAVQQAGYNASASYAASCLAIYDEQPTVFNWLGMSRDGDSLLGGIIKTVLLYCLVFALLALCVWLLWRAILGKGHK